MYVLLTPIQRSLALRVALDGATPEEHEILTARHAHLLDEDDLVIDAMMADECMEPGPSCGEPEILESQVIATPHPINWGPEPWLKDAYEVDLGITFLFTVYLLILKWSF